MFLHIASSDSLRLSGEEVEAHAPYTTEWNLPHENFLRMSLSSNDLGSERSELGCQSVGLACV